MSKQRWLFILIIYLLHIVLMLTISKMFKFLSTLPVWEQIGNTLEAFKLN